MTMADGAPAIRVVLRPQVTLDEIEDAALDLDWLLVRSWPASGERPYEDLYLAADEQTEISFLDDDLVDLHYLVIRGPGAASAEAQARESFAVYEPADAARAWADATTVEDKIVAVHLLALTAGPGDVAPATEALLGAATDADPQVRRAVIRAATYVGWPPLRQALAELERHDADETVRRDARWAREGFAIGDAGSPPR